MNIMAKRTEWHPEVVMWPAQCYPVWWPSVHVVICTVVSKPSTTNIASSLQCLKAAWWHIWHMCQSTATNCCNVQCQPTAAMTDMHFDWHPLVFCCCMAFWTCLFCTKIMQMIVFFCSGVPLSQQLECSSFGVLLMWLILQIFILHQCAWITVKHMLTLTGILMDDCHFAKSFGSINVDQS